LPKLGSKFRYMSTYGEQLELALAKQIRIELAERDMEQKDLADALSIGRSSLNRYMQNHQSFPMPVFFRVAEVFGLSPKVLMERAEARIQPGE
jgi:transcriptional regulator with XRE-family HTH domain